MIPLFIKLSVYIIQQFPTKLLRKEGQKEGRKERKEGERKKDGGRKEGGKERRTEERRKGGK